MRKLIVGVVVILVLAVGGLLAAPYFVPTDTYRARIEEAAEAALGRNVTVSDDIKIRLLPRITVSAGASSVDNPDGFGDDKFASMGELRVAVKVLPLFSKRVEVDEFILVDPAISLIQLADGRNNWTFETGAPPPEDIPEDAPNTPPNTGGFSTALGDVRLVNGDIKFADKQAGVSHHLKDLNIKIDLKSFDAPLAVKGDGVLDDLAFSLDAGADNLQNLLDGVTTGVTADFSTDIVAAKLDGDVTMGEDIALNLKVEGDAKSVAKLADFAGVQDLPAREALGSADISANVSGKLGDLTLSNLTFAHASDLLKIDFKGSAKVGDAISYNGDLAINAPKLRALAASADVELPPGDIYRKFALSGQAAGSLTRAKLSNAKIVFDDIEGTGGVDLNLSGARPAITGQLDVGTLNITPYAAASGAGEGAATSKTSTQGWPETELDLSPLNTVDMDLRLSASGLTYQGINIGKSVLRVTLNNGRLIADLTETSLYGGGGAAQIIADMSGGTPKVGLSANLNALNTAPFLSAIANFDKVEGVGGLTINLEGQGTSVAAIMKSLNGGGSFKFDNGAIKGFNAAQLMRSAQEFLTTGAVPQALSAEQETNFTNFSASFNIKDGLARTNDLNLLNPLLQIPGEGALNLGERKLSLSLSPRSGDKALGINGFAPPLKISGSWDKLSVGLDQQWIAQQLKAQLGASAAKELGLNETAAGAIFGEGKEAEEKRREVVAGALQDLLEKNKKKKTKEPESTVPTPTPTASGAAAADETEPEAEKEPEKEKSVEEQLEDEAKKQLLKLFE